MGPGANQEGGPAEGAVWAKCVADMEAKGQPVKGLVEDWKKAFGGEGLDPDPDLLAQMPWSK